MTKKSPAARAAAAIAVLVAGVSAPMSAQAPIKAAVPASKPAWSRGIQPISRDSYYHAIECGKLGGAQPSCVFYDAELCKNDDSCWRSIRRTSKWRTRCGAR
jgi:hypothetical protein